MPLVLLGAGILLATRPHHRLAPAGGEQRTPEPIGARPALAAIKPPRPRMPPPEPIEPATMPLSAAQPPPPTKPAWLRFAAAAPAGGRPLVAVVIDDLGLDRRRTADVLRLPAPLTLSFMTYAQDLPEQTEAGRRAGDELLLHVPMEPVDRRANPGPHALYVAMSPAVILNQLRWGLDRFTGFVGINNHMGSRFTADAPGMSVVMAELRRRGLLFLDSKTTAASTGSREAAADGVPHAARDVFLDDDLRPGAIDRQLGRVEEVARRNGSAIAIGHAHDPTIAALQVWLPTLPGKGFALAPLSTVVQYRLRHGLKAGN